MGLKFSDRVENIVEQERQIVAKYARLTPSCNHPRNFIASIVLEIIHRTKFKYENKQRAITQKLSKQKLRFMCTALPLDEIYSPTKFHNHS